MKLYSALEEALEDIECTSEEATIWEFEGTEPIRYFEDRMTGAVTLLGSRIVALGLPLNPVSEISRIFFELAKMPMSMQSQDG